MNHALKKLCAAVADVDGGAAADKPEHGAEACYAQARELHRRNEIAAAIPLYQQVLQAGAHGHAEYLLGQALMAVDRAEEALPYLQALMQLRPGFIDGWLALGDCYAGLGEDQKSWNAYRSALRIDPGCERAVLQMCGLLSKRESWSKLEAFADKMAERFTDSSKLLRFRLQSRHVGQKYLEGILLLVEFLAKKPDMEACYRWYEELFGRIQVPGKDLLDPLAELQHPRLKVLYLRALMRAKKAQEALKLYDEIRSEHDPDGKLVNEVNMGLIFTHEKLHQHAEPFLWEALQKNPMNYGFYPTVINNLLSQAKDNRPEKFNEARELAQIWLEADPENPQALAAMGSIYSAASRPEISLQYEQKLLEAHPDHPLRQSRLFVINYDERLTPDEVFEAHRSWGEQYEKKIAAVATVVRPWSETAPRPLRIGYLSPDLGYHPVGTFFIDIFAQHQREEFEYYLYSNRFADEGDDPRSQEFRKLCGEERWRWTRGLETDDLVKLIQADGIDILVELAGHTAYNRLDVMARKPAPVQVSWLGYPNTTGLSRIDYRFSDAITEPEGEFDRRSTEKIYRLPNGFHVFSPPPHTPAPAPAPCVRNGYVTFGTYNNMNKLGSQSIELWAELLKRVPRSRILIKHSTLAVLDNRESLLSQFAKYGIQSWRVDLRQTTAGHQQHLQSYGDIDIALDPLFYNGTTTTCDALSVGVPVLTLPGATHSARVSASLIHRIGLGHWVARDREHFLDIGRKAAQNFQMLNEVRRQIQQAFEASPLRDGAAMARDLETAYRTMWQRYLQQEPTN